MVGLTSPLGEVFDLFILDDDLAPQKLVLALDAFQLFDVGRDLSRLVGTCRGSLRRWSIPILGGDIADDWSRRVATSRDGAHFLNVGDVLVIEAGVIRYFSPNDVSIRRQSRWPLAQ